MMTARYTSFINFLESNLTSKILKNILDTYIHIQKKHHKFVSYVTIFKNSTTFP